MQQEGHAGQAAVQDAKRVPLSLVLGQVSELLQENTRIGIPKRIE